MSGTGIGVILRLRFTSLSKTSGPGETAEVQGDFRRLEWRRTQCAEGCAPSFQGSGARPGLELLLSHCTESQIKATLDRKP